MGWFPGLKAGLFGAESGPRYYNDCELRGVSSNTGDSLSLQSAADGQKYGVDVNSHRIHRRMKWKAHEFWTLAEITDTDPNCLSAGDPGALTHCELWFPCV